MPVVDVLPATFITYCKCIPGAEAIDDLYTPPGLKKADFLFNGRTIVCEIKSLETETNDKVIPILRAAGIPLQPGHCELTQLLAGHPYYKRLYRQCTNAITTGLKDGIDEANRQIRDSKKAFGLEVADGLLVLLHAKVRVLNPPVIMKRMFDRFRKKDSAGGPALGHISAVILISELYKLHIEGIAMAANIPVRNDAVPEHFNVSAFMDTLDLGWAAWTGRSHHIVSASDFEIAVGGPAQ